MIRSFSVEVSIFRLFKKSIIISLIFDSLSFTRSSVFSITPFAFLAFVKTSENKTKFVITGKSIKYSMGIENTYLIKPE